MYKYLDVIELAKQYFMIIGRHLNFEKKEADVANAVIFKKDDVLYIIDSGALIDFRKILYDKCNSLLPFNKIVLLNTHGHCDHVANNIIIDQIDAIEKDHYISVHDLKMMQNNRNYFLESFKQAAPFMTDGLSPEDRVDHLMNFFAPLDVNTSCLKTLETLPTEDIIIGSIHWSGWKISDALYVLRSEGHSRGHVIAYFPELSHIHMGDEINSYCNIFHDCDNLKSLESHTKLITMLNEGTVTSMTSSHEFLLFNKDEAKEKIESLINSHYVYDHIFQDLLLAHPDGLSFSDIKNGVENSVLINQLSKSANPNPLFATLMLLSKFRDFGIVPDRSDLANALFQFQGKIDGR